jgi:LacI family transcriptional regulator
MGDNAVRAERHIANTGRPVVMVSSNFSESFPLVEVDYYSAGYLMAKHVISQGRRRLLAISQGFTSRSIEERFHGIEIACSESPGVSFDRVRPAGQHISQVETGYMLTRNLPESRLPDAVFYSNDRMACGGLNALREREIRVPDDIAVCGFDGIDIAEYSIPPLTTAVQPVAEMAEESVNIMTEMLSNPSYVPPKLTKLPCDVIFRQSSG